MRAAAQNLNKVVQIHPNNPQIDTVDYLFSSFIKDDIHLGDHVTPMPYTSRFSWMKGILAVYATTESLYFDEWVKDGDGAIASVFDGIPENPSITDPFALAGEQEALTEAHYRVSDKVLRYVDKVVPSWDALTDAAESRQLYSLVEDVSRRFRDIFSGVLHRRPRQILRGFGIKPTISKRRAVRQKLYLYSKKTTSWSVHDAVGDLYLTYRYGITPALRSLDDAVNAFGTATWVPDVFLPIKEGTRLMKTDIYTSGVSQGTIRADVVMTRANSGFLTYRGLLSFRDSIMERIKGSIPLRAAATLWELVPWSFVIDWFVSVGDWLSKLSVADIVGKSSEIFCSSYLTVNVDKIFKDIRPSTQYGLLRLSSVHPYGTQIEASTTVFRRYRVNLTVRPPRFKPGFSSSAFTHAIDSLFLLLGVAKRARRQSYVRPQSY